MAGTVLITGCSSGFGEAAARLFASRGFNVVATARRPETARHLEAAGNIFMSLSNRVSTRRSKSTRRLSWNALSA